METKNTQIVSYNDLIARIDELKSEKSRQEEVLKEDLQRLAESLNPVARLKNAIHNLATDSDLYVDLARGALNMALRFVMKKLWGNRREEANGMGPAIAESLISWIVNGNLAQAVAFVRNRFHHPEEEATATAEPEG